MSEKRKVLVKKDFEKSFEKIVDYINENSEQNAQKFVKEVNEKIQWIIRNPTAGTPESRIHSEKKWYRFKIVMKSWKIVYKVTKSLLIFLQILHTKQDAKDFRKLRTTNYE